MRERRGWSVDRFLSHYANRFDAKGRLSVPAPFRAVLAKEGFEGVFAHPSLISPALDCGGTALLDEIHGLLDRQRPPLLEPGGEVVPLEVFHHQEFGCAVAAYVMQNADVRMLQLRDDSAFAFKASAQRGIRYQLRVQNFDRDSSVQPRIPCPVHFPHSTRP